MKNFITLFTSLLFLLLFVGCSESDNAVGSDGSGSTSNSGLHGGWVLDSKTYSEVDNPAANYKVGFSLTDTTKCLANEILVFKDNGTFTIVSVTQNGFNKYDHNDTYCCADNYLYFSRDSYYDTHALFSVSGSTLTLKETDTDNKYTVTYTYKKYSGEIEPFVWDEVSEGTITFKYNEFDYEM